MKNLWLVALVFFLIAEATSSFAKDFWEDDDDDNDFALALYPIQVEGQALALLQETLSLGMNVGLTRKLTGGFYYVYKMENKGKNEREIASTYHGPHLNAYYHRSGILRDSLYMNVFAGVLASSYKLGSDARTLDGKSSATSHVYRGGLVFGYSNILTKKKNYIKFGLGFQYIYFPDKGLPQLKQLEEEIAGEEQRSWHTVFQESNGRMHPVVELAIGINLK